MKLISMTDFVLEQCSKMPESGQIETLFNIFNFANFLKQPLTLGMFVPCDADGNVLEEPKPENYFDVNKPSDKFNEEDKEGLNSYSSALMYYDDAKTNLLFIGCEIEKRWGNIHVTKHGNTVFFSNWPKTTVEQIVKHRIELTESAKKQIGI